MGIASVDRVSVFPGRKLGALLNVLYADKHHSRQIQDQCYSAESGVHTRKASLRQFLDSGENVCGPHQETKRIFCEDEGCLLCSHYSSSQEHEAHRRCSFEEAVEESRVSDAL